MEEVEKAQEAQEAWFCLHSMDTQAAGLKARGVKCVC